MIICAIAVSREPLGVRVDDASVSARFRLLALLIVALMGGAAFAPAAAAKAAKTAAVPYYLSVGEPDLTAVSPAARPEFTTRAVRRKEDGANTCIAHGCGYGARGSRRPSLGIRVRRRAG